MREHFQLALRNVTDHGDTDIFPYPVENRIFHDEQDRVLDLLEDYHANFQDYLVRFPPAHISSLAPVSYTGFRWASQLDPIWNLYFLGCVLAIAPDIENARLPVEDNKIYSYRFNPDQDTASLFNRDIGWVQFIERSTELAGEYSHVVVCDISEFYPRLGHHRLENALQQLNFENDIPSRLMAFLKQFSGTRSFGLPIGGPAARLLSELVLNQVDRLLTGHDIEFARFADDYHLFANSLEDAYAALIYLSEKLFDNQGLSLQKSKTRILSSAEFLATSPLRFAAVQEDENHNDPDAAEAQERTRQFMRFSIRFDPYSPTADEDYETLKREINKFDIIGMLGAELAKSQIHTALSRRVLRAIRFLDDPVRDEAVVSIVNNHDLLFPIFSTVAMVVYDIIDAMGEASKTEVITYLRQLIEDKSYTFRVDMHLAYAIRVLSKQHTQENENMLQQLYDLRTSSMIRRDIILTMAHWRAWPWLSDLMNRFRGLSDAERRAFIIASYTLRDEGRHWRRQIRNELSPFEKLVRDWASGRIEQDPDWRVPV